MTCICKPWKGFHLPECPCQAAYVKLRALEKLEYELSPDDAELLAKKLVREGWQQQSRKYRRLVRVSQASSAIAELERHDPELAADIRARAAHFLETEARQALWRFAETQEVSPQVFEAFRKVK